MIWSESFDITGTLCWLLQRWREKKLSFVEELCFLLDVVHEKRLLGVGNTGFCILLRFGCKFGQISIIWSKVAELCTLTGFILVECTGAACKYIRLLRFYVIANDRH